MYAVQQLNQDHRDRIIEHSIRRKVQTVLARRGVTGWRTYKSRLVSGSRPEDAVRIQVYLPRDGSLAQLPNPGETLGLTFRLGHQKCMFSSVVQSAQEGANVAVVTLCWPDYLDQLQRRAYERVAPPPGQIIVVRFWRDETQSRGEAAKRNVRYGQLEDLSAGGMRVNAVDVTDAEPGEGYWCVFSVFPGAASLILETTLRHREAADQGRASLGFQFFGLETTADGRRQLDQLARLVGRLKSAPGRA